MDDSGLYRQDSLLPEQGSLALLLSLQLRAMLGALCLRGTPRAIDRVDELLSLLARAKKAHLSECFLKRRIELFAQRGIDHCQCSSATLMSMMHCHALSCRTMLPHEMHRAN